MWVDDADTPNQVEAVLTMLGDSTRCI